MTPTFSLQTHRTARMVAHLFACLALTTVSGLAAAEPDQSRLAPPPGDGWQLLSAPVAKAPVAQLAMVAPSAHVAAAVPVVPAAPASPAALNRPLKYTRVEAASLQSQGFRREVFALCKPNAIQRPF
jgi:hypothetical protein